MHKIIEQASPLEQWTPQPGMYDAIYIPSGVNSQLTIRYNTKTLQPVGHTWTNGAGYSHTSNTLTDTEKRLFELMELTPTQSEIELELVFFCVWAGNESSDKVFSESKLPEFLYIYAVGTQDPEDTEDITFFPFKRWENVRFLKKSERLYNAQDWFITPLDLSNVGKELLKSITSHNPFNHTTKSKGIGNGMLLVPRTHFQLQRLENWVFVKN